ncbi:MAG: hypothetical protein KF752_07250 [Pirellulaceae bacterium]|nr:hypothetical protein [Pirellulaceae bacterium]
MRFSSRNFLTLSHATGNVSSPVLLVIVLTLSMLAVLRWRVGTATEQSHNPPPSGYQWAQGSSQAEPNDGLHPVIINQLPTTLALNIQAGTRADDSITAQCSVCHANRRPNFEIRAASDLREFHRDVSVAHGSVSCLSCHNPSDYQTLRLADGTPIPLPDVMQLCGQCHGQQLREYQHGVHGGMNGYWDRRRGPQYKNHCIDCHPPHHPKFPKMQTDFKPQDRFLSGPSARPGGGSHD